MAHTDREIEWQLAGEDLGVVQRWLGANPEIEGLRIAPLPPQRLHDTYLDTVDWRIFHGGFALRIRARAGIHEATLKSLRSARADVADRREITEVITERPDSLVRATGPVGSQVSALAGREPLRVLFIAETLRSRFGAHSLERAAAAEIALDETRLCSCHGTPIGRLQRVEVELTGGTAQALLPFVTALRSGCALERATENKFAAGLRAAGLAPMSA
jgi:inorganic triphosphatase YgiF